MLPLPHGVPSAWFNLQIIRWVGAGLTPAGLWDDLRLMGTGSMCSALLRLSKVNI